MTGKLLLCVTLIAALIAALIVALIAAGSVPASAQPFICQACTPQAPEHAVLKVGQSEEYKTVKAAVDAANADTSSKEYVIQIAAGTYTDEFMNVTRPMTLAAAGGPVIMRATVPPSNGKAIIVAMAPLEVDGLTFTGVRNATFNGAGIRDHNHPGGSLTVTNSVFELNDVGIMTDSRAVDEVVTISNSKFLNNGNRGQHALYVNAGRLTVEGSLFCGQLVGHNIKSRAADTLITDNQLYDGAANAALGCNQGTTAMAIDISNGGKMIITGNNIVQGPGSPQFRMIGIAHEGLRYDDNQLVVTGNRFASPGTPHSTAISDIHCIRARLGSRIADNTYDHILSQIDPAICAAAR